MVRTRHEAPRAPSDRSAASRMVEIALLGAAGATIGCLLLLVPSSVRTLSAQAVLLVVMAVNTGVIVVEGMHRRRRADAEERGSPVRSTAPLLGRPSVRRAYAVLFGVGVTGLWVLAGAGITGTAFPAVAGALFLAFLLLVGLSRRNRLAAARAADPGAAVVLVGLADLATTRLAQWAKATGTRLPASLVSRWALVADTDGLRLSSASRTARPLPRWQWCDVELRRGPHPSYPDAPRAAVLVLTLLGPEPAARARTVPLGRHRFEVTLTVLHGTWSATPEVVDAALADLLSRRPVRASIPASTDDGAA